MRLPDLESLSATEVAKLLDVTDRAIRKWVSEKGLPCNGGSGVMTFRWADVYAWDIKRKTEDAGTRGTPVKFQPSEPSERPTETYDEALCRKTRAEADIKELQLARERGEVATIADVERVLAASTLATQTQILAVPSRLATRMLGIEEHGTAVTILDGEMRQLLSNLATIDAVREASGLDESA